MNQAGSFPSSRRTFLKGLATGITSSGGSTPQSRAEGGGNAGNRRTYDPTWESLDQRPVAPWWREAKFGIYVHWALASVPGWGNHSSFL